MNVLQLNKDLVSKANKFIESTNLPEIISKYGKPYFVGSYRYKLMIWQDIDIDFVRGDIGIEGFFKLGCDLAKVIQPKSMKFTDHLTYNPKHDTEGYYWGIQTNDGWKVDIWAVDEKRVLVHEDQMRVFENKLNDEFRKFILEIKYNVHEHPDFRKLFFSWDIYTSVVHDGCKNIKEFESWLRNKKELNYSF